MVGHDYKLMEQKSLLLPIMGKRVNQETGSRFAAKDGQSASGDCGNKENTIGVHDAIVVELRPRSL